MSRIFDLERAITKVMRKYGIERPTAAQWNFVLTKTHVPGIHKNATRINLDRLELLLHQYILISYLHDQFVSVYGFCKLSGISREVIYGWSRVNAKSRKGCRQAQSILTTLKEERAVSIANSLETTSRCLGAIALLRHEYAWTQEKIEDFADMHGLICADPQSVKERYRAVADSENA